MSAQTKAPATTAADLLELVSYTYLKDGRVQGVLDAGTGGKIKLVGKTMQGVSNSMQTLCEVVAAKLEAQRHDARQAESLMRKILTDIQR